jgi:hypothetical protein
MPHNVNPKSHICTNPECRDGQPHWAGFGRRSRRKCSQCGQPLREIKGEPYGTPHYR